MLVLTLSYKYPIACKTERISHKQSHIERLNMIREIKNDSKLDTVMRMMMMMMIIY